mgnify:FL=1
MRKLGWFLALASLALAGCGGGDSSFGGGSSSGGSSGSTNVATVTVTASGASVPADGSASVTITALVRDASNVAVSNQLVTFSSSAGSLVVVQATTDGTRRSS